MTDGAIAARDEADVRDAIAGANASGQRIEIVGGASKSGIGQPNRKTTRLSLASLSKVVDYDPAELVLTLEPGARLVDIEAMLAQRNQMLAFEPFDFAAVSGQPADASTIGGIIGAGITGSRRLSAGGVRDHVLGFSAVSGRGEIFKSGGRVVKNVTGYDLSKLMAGSWGQLAALTQVTVKVLPRPRVQRTVALRGLSAEQAVDAMGRGMRSRAEVAAAAHTVIDGKGVTALRLEGVEASVAVRVDMLMKLFTDAGGASVLAANEAEVFWQGVQTARVLGGSADDVLWRIVVPPASGAHVTTAIGARGGATLLDWAGGLVWAKAPASVAAKDIRAVASGLGGHAMLVRAPTDYRLATPALHPDAPGVAALSQRVKAAFDPLGVLDLDRFAEPAA